MKHYTNQLGTIVRKATGVITVCFVAAPVAVWSVTLSVTSLDDTGPGTLRQALVEANDGDAIRCSVSGTVFLSAGQLEVTKSVSIEGPGPQTLTLAGDGTRIFYIAPGLKVAISGVAITGGYGGSDFGGGIWNDHSVLTLRDCWINGNFTYSDGGGIFNDGRWSGSAQLTIADSIVSENWANGAGGIKNDGSFGGNATTKLSNCAVTYNYAFGFHGGGVWNDGYQGKARLEIDGSSFNWNSAYATVGGGVANDGYNGSVALSIDNSTFRGNISTGGGAVSNVGEQSGSADCAVNASTFDQNISYGGGGGIWNDGINGLAKLNISASTLSANFANGFYGGGVWNDGYNGGTAVLAIQNSTLSGNASPNSRGGAIANDGYAGNANLLLRSVTLSQNSASSGGTLFNEGGGSGNALIDMENTILDQGGNPWSGGTMLNNFGDVASAGFNLCSDDAGGALTSPSDLLNTDPLLGPLQDNGGPTFTHALLPGSPAFNGGNPASTPRANFDQRGKGFPRKVGTRIDIGAFEAKPWELR